MNKITKEYIESRIEDVTYMVKDTLTICIITLDNGFKEMGESACVDPANFNKELGEKYAYEKTVSKLWSPFGFALCEKRSFEGNELYKRLYDLCLEIEKLPASEQQTNVSVLASSICKSVID